MRTSGASSDGRLALIPIAAALLLLVLLAGGPSAFLTTAEQTLRSLADALIAAVRSAA